MKNKFSKALMLGLVAIICIGLGISLSSTTTIEDSNTQQIRDLAGHLEAVTSELEALKAESSESVSSDPFLGQIIMFGGNFAPRGWALCDGQLLPISQNTALFSLLGTTYGGDGRTTFGLPDLRGRVPLHQGRGPGLSPIRLGQKSGSETNTLTVSNMPSHSHRIVADLPTHNFESGEDFIPGNTALLGVANAVNGTVHEEFSTSPAGNSQAVNNMQPYQAVNFIIALQGTFPSRN